jgi:hypothetical protein
MALMGVFFQSNVSDFYFKTNIMTDVSTIYQTDPDLMVFNDTNVAFAVSIQQANFAGNPLMNITME